MSADLYENPLPGAGRNGNILVLIDCVSVIDVWEIKITVPVLMGRDDNNLIRRSASVDSGDLRINFVKTLEGQPDCERLL